MFWVHMGLSTRNLVETEVGSRPEGLLALVSHSL